MLLKISQSFLTNLKELQFKNQMSNFSLMIKNLRFLDLPRNLKVLRKESHSSLNKMMRLENKQAISTKTCKNFTSLQTNKYLTLKHLNKIHLTLLYSREFKNK